jgi:flagellar biosynthesis protein FlhB
MADQDKDNRTEDPTEKRLSKAREDGRVPRSPDLPLAFALLLASMLIDGLGRGLCNGFGTTLTAALRDIEQGGLNPNFALGGFAARLGAFSLLPLLAALFGAGLVVGFAQAGLHFVPQKLDFKPERLEPRLSITTFINLKSLAETAVSLLKLAALGIAAWITLNDPIRRLLAVGSAREAGVAGFELLLGLLNALGWVLLVIGFLDWMWKKRQHIADLRMTKDEVKQENKDAMGDQEAKARIRSRQKQFAMQHMMEQVPKATAVIVNPTHYAVALRYERSMAAPLVVAKGRDHIALTIKTIARKHAIPIIENPPLARALHDSARIGDEIPPTLYEAVAKVLAVILRTNRRVERRPA